MMGHHMHHGAAGGLAMAPPPHAMKPPKKKKKLADKILPQKVRELVPESQAYMDLLSFERKLDSTIMRKRLDIQEALKRPMKQKKKLRIFISNTAFPAKDISGSGMLPEASDSQSQTGQDTSATASWELRVEGRVIEDDKKVLLSMTVLTYSIRA